MATVLARSRCCVLNWSRSDSHSEVKGSLEIALLRYFRTSQRSGGRLQAGTMLCTVRLFFA